MLHVCDILRTWPQKYRFIASSIITGGVGACRPFWLPLILIRMIADLERNPVGDGSF
jgi:hypothetical protein